ncbi:MAG: hypothetical protein PVSMB7_12060 [Chloroflexota bacterium]
MYPLQQEKSISLGTEVDGPPYLVARQITDSPVQHGAHRAPPAIEKLNACIPKKFTCTVRHIANTEIQTDVPETVI